MSDPWYDRTPEDKPHEYADIMPAKKGPPSEFLMPQRVLVVRGCEGQMVALVVIPEDPRDPEGEMAGVMEMVAYDWWRAREAAAQGEDFCPGDYNTSVVPLTYPEDESPEEG